MYTSLCEKSVYNTILEWGGCAASPRDENFLREGGGRLRILSSVCVSVCLFGFREGDFLHFHENDEISTFLRKYAKFHLFYAFSHFLRQKCPWAKMDNFTSKKLVRRALLRHWAQKDAKLSKFRNFATFRTFHEKC